MIKTSVETPLFLATLAPGPPPGPPHIFLSMAALSSTVVDLLNLPYFELEGDSKVKCLLCVSGLCESTRKCQMKPIKLSKNRLQSYQASALYQHFKSHHASMSLGSSGSSGTMKMNSFFPKMLRVDTSTAAKAAFRELVAKFVLSTNIPFAAVQNQYLVDMMVALGVREDDAREILPNDKTLRNKGVNAVYDKWEQEVIARLVSTPVAVVMIDEFTSSMLHTGFLLVVVTYYKGGDLRTSSRVTETIGFAHINAESLGQTNQEVISANATGLAHIVDGVLRKMGIREKVHVMVSDTTAVMPKTANVLFGKVPAEVWLPCLSHRLHLVVTGALAAIGLVDKEEETHTDEGVEVVVMAEEDSVSNDEDDTSNTVVKIRKIASFFRRSNKGMALLEDKIEELEKQLAKRGEISRRLPRRLVMEVKTRWGSLASMLARAWLVRVAIDDALDALSKGGAKKLPAKLTGAEWDTAKLVSSSLKDIGELTVQSQSDGMLASKTWYEVKRLRDKLGKAQSETSSPFAEALVVHMDKLVTYLKQFPKLILATTFDVTIVKQTLYELWEMAGPNEATLRAQDRRSAADWVKAKIVFYAEEQYNKLLADDQREKEIENARLLLRTATPAGEAAVSLVGESMGMTSTVADDEAEDVEDGETIVGSKRRREDEDEVFSLRPFTEGGMFDDITGSSTGSSSTGSEPPRMNRGPEVSDRKVIDYMVTGFLQLRQRNAYAKKEDVLEKTLATLSAVETTLRAQIEENAWYATDEVLDRAHRAMKNLATELLLPSASAAAVERGCSGGSAVSMNPKRARITAEKFGKAAVLYPVLSKEATLKKRHKK